MRPSRTIPVRTPRSLDRATVALAVCGMVLAAGTAGAATLYVNGGSPAASPSGPGTLSQPYKTISAAAKVAVPGTTILVSPGVYYELVTVPVSGTGADPIVYFAEGPGVIVEGADDFSSPAAWAPYSGPINLDSPNSAWPVIDGDVYLAAGVTWVPKQVFLDGARLTPSTAAPESLPARSFRAIEGEGLYLNAGGGTPGAHAVLVGHRANAFRVNGKANVWIEGFTAAHTEDKGIHVLGGSSAVTVAGNTVSFSASNGIGVVGSANVTLRGNVAADNADHGFALLAGVTGSLVEGNEAFRNARPTTRAANGIYLSASTGNRIVRNRWHDNQDSGEQFSLGANDNVSIQNLSYANGDHGFDHLSSTGNLHLGDIAYGNYKDGFSFEGNSPGSRLFDCIAVDNGLTTAEYDLWVDAASSVGFVSNSNLFWNSNGKSPVKYGNKAYSSVSTYSKASGNDARSKQADPRFVNAAAGDFHLRSASPAIDMADASLAEWPGADFEGRTPADDWATANTGLGAVTYGDIGAFEYVPADRAPVVTAPATVGGTPGVKVTFTVTAADPDGQAITSLTADFSGLPAGNNATFVVNATNTLGTFTWTPATTDKGNKTVTFTASNVLSGSATSHVKLSGKAPKGAEAEAVGVPLVLGLSNAYPNPTVGQVAFRLELPEEAHVDFDVFDVMGRTLMHDGFDQAAGRTVLRWDGTLGGRRAANAGIYFAKVRVGDQTFTRRFLLNR